MRPDLSRIFDVILALAALVLTGPLFVVVPLLILWNDGGPVFFRQRRIGLRGQPFMILKFRTMQAGSNGGMITAAGDGRVTRLGARLRKYKLDELPQFLNVLRGDMSFIGPRPEVPNYVQLNDDRWRSVLQMRPGITDLATLAFRHEEEILAATDDPEAHYRTEILPAKLSMNLAYQRSRSFATDVRLLCLTVRYSLFPKSFNEQHITRIIARPGNL